MLIQFLLLVCQLLSRQDVAFLLVFIFFPNSVLLLEMLVFFPILDLVLVRVPIVFPLWFLVELWLLVQCQTLLLPPLLPW